MIRQRVTFWLGSPVLLPNQGPATPDSWLAWAQMAKDRPAFRTIRPQARDWIVDVPLPLAHDPRTNVWSISALHFPDPGVWVSNTGYRNDGNTGDLQHHAEAFSSLTREKESLYSAREQRSGIFRAMVFDLSGWFTPRFTFDVACDSEQVGALEHLLHLLAAVGVGRKAMDGYGVVRDWTWEPIESDPVWEPDGRPRRPVPAMAVPDDCTEARYVYQLAGARWLGVPTLCAGPGPEHWHPALWTPPQPAQTHSPTEATSLLGSQE